MSPGARSTSSTPRTRAAWRRTPAPWTWPSGARAPPGPERGSGAGPRKAKPREIEGDGLKPPFADLAFSEFGVSRAATRRASESRPPSPADPRHHPRGAHHKAAEEPELRRHCTLLPRRRFVVVCATCAVATAFCRRSCVQRHARLCHRTLLKKQSGRLARLLAAGESSPGCLPVCFSLSACLYPSVPFPILHVRPRFL